MTEGELFCLHEASRCLELSEHFKALGRLDDRAFWIRVYNEFLRDAHGLKEVK